ncbi:MAG TPA: adenylate/guanylate cyclase domain-containing protein, partial [Acidimicrobiales bacterium]|nr:adenylate/guanylate cyclase domain-containing protein [Acidimicrobiales bacterium]
NAAERGYDILFAAGPSVCNDEAFRSWWVKAGYRGASPAAARAVMSVNCFADLRAVLPFVRVPTLVLHRHNVMLPVHHGRYLAEHIPGARYMEMDGSDFIYWIGDSDAMLDEIEEFVTGTRHGPSADRRLATILFTDIVDSTGHVARMGDRRWQGLLEKHSLMMDRQLTRFGGHLIKDMGDGWLATFDGPAAAVNCACAIRADALLSGLELRVGVHTGEVQIREGDISGLAVHIAARVQALAQTGELLVSRTVVDLVAGSGIRFIDRGEHELKGVPGRWQVFAVLD